MCGWKCLEKPFLNYCGNFIIAKETILGPDSVIPFQHFPLTRIVLAASLQRHFKINMPLYRANGNFVENKKAFKSDFQSINCPLLVCVSRADKIWVRIDHWDGNRWENSVQVETSQTYASRRTAFWRRTGTRAQTPAGLTLLQAWWRRQTKLKREGLLGRQCQSRRKDGAGGRTRRVTRAYLDTNAHIAHTLH